MIADYERSNFSVSQCVSNEKMTNNIVAIDSPQESNGTKGLKKSTLIAIVVAVVVFLAISSILAICWFRCRKSRKSVAGGSSDQVSLDKNNTAEAGTEASADHRRFEMTGREKDHAHELLVVNQVTEIAGAPMAHELSAVDRVVELPAGRNGA